MKDRLAFRLLQINGNAPLVPVRMIPSIRPRLFFARLLISSEMFSRPARRLLIAVGLRSATSSIFRTSIPRSASIRSPSAPALTGSDRACENVLKAASFHGLLSFMHGYHNTPSRCTRRRIDELDGWYATGTARASVGQVCYHVNLGEGRNRNVECPLSCSLEVCPTSQQRPLTPLLKGRALMEFIFVAWRMIIEGIARSNTAECLRQPH
jgi:hypothetical protein